MDTFFYRFIAKWGSTRQPGVVHPQMIPLILEFESLLAELTVEFQAIQTVVDQAVVDLHAGKTLDDLGPVVHLAVRTGGLQLDALDGAEERVAGGALHDLVGEGQAVADRALPLGQHVRHLAALLAPAQEQRGFHPMAGHARRRRRQDRVFPFLDLLDAAVRFVRVLERGYIFKHVFVFNVVDIFRA